MKIASPKSLSSSLFLMSAVTCFTA